jgi:AraC family transcriptional activator of pobA
LRHEPASVYAKHLDVETKHLHGVMYALTGMSFLEWQRRYLLLMAKELLRDTDMNCLEIARFMHFGSNTAFSQWLVPLLGCHPSEWRKL